MSDGFRFDVFLSHGSTDKDVVRDVANRLKSDGERVWLIRDDRDGSENHLALHVINRRGNMIDDNLFGNRTEIDSTSSHITGNANLQHRI